jgi:hypothetical protein
VPADPRLADDELAELLQLIEPTIDLDETAPWWERALVDLKASRAEVARLRQAIESHRQSSTAPGCGHAALHRDESLWSAIGVDRWGDPR